MEPTAPVRRYHHAIFDSARWDHFTHRPGDIVVTTSMKAGTTWMQAIVAALVFRDEPPPGRVLQISPWLDAKRFPVDEVVAALDAQTHRRFIKTHTPADGLPLRPDVSYIVVGRDGRDVFMSTINHWATFRPDVIAMFNEMAERDGIAPMPEYDGDIHGAFATWISEGSFPWQQDGAPWWSHFSHAATWWPLRHEPNVLFVHYADLKRDLEGEMRGVADYLGIDVPEERWPDLVARCTFEGMKARADEIHEFEVAWVGGADAFLYKGTNGRWRDVLTADELTRYDEHVRAVLDDDVAAWLEHGKAALPSRP